MLSLFVLNPCDNSTLAFLHTLLASSHYTHNPVFFVLDHFDLFAHPPPAKQ